MQIHDDGGTADGGVDTSAAQTFVINVTAVNSKPTATSSSLTATQGVATALTLSGSDIETAAANLTFNVGSPAHGTLSGTAPNLTYQPVAGYTGPDSLTFTVTDRGDPDNCGAPGLLCAAALTSDLATVSITVVKANSSTTIASSANPSAYSTPITLTATVTPVPAGSAIPGGSMTFMDGTTTIGSAAVNVGIATLATSALTAGSHALTAVYSGDSNFNTSTSSSLTQNVNKKAASVTPNATSKAYGAADPALTGTLSGFLAADGVTATYSRTAGETVAGGPYAISATLSPAGVLANYTITYNTADFTITKATASVTPNAASKTYGAADPALTGTLSGFLAADGVTATYSRTAGETVAGGPYAISATLSPAAALANYTITYNTASFTINKATASVTPNAASKTYGAADPALTGTLSGFLAADGVTATYSRTAGETVAGSPYTISATLSPAAALANYTVTYNTASFTITKATASVTPNAASKTYGAADPAFTGTLSGFLAADGVTATYSRTAGETVAGGPYTISATLSPASALGNYTITYNTASFTINKATASVTPNAASKTYGAADPALTGTLSGFLAADGVTATYSRTAGETVAGSPYTISATLSPAGVLANYTITYNTASFTITKATASVTPNAAEQDLRRGGPGVDRDAERLPGRGRRDGDLQPDGGRDRGGQPVHHQRDARARRRARQLHHHLQHGELHDHQGDGVGDAERGEQDLRRRRPGVDGHAERLPGRRRRDGDLQPRGRRDRRGRSLHDQRDVEPGGVLANYTITHNTASFTITPATASVTPAGEQDLRRGRPGVDRDAERLPRRRRRDGDLQPHGGRDRGGQPVRHQRDAEPGGRAGQLQRHLQHRQLHDHEGERVGDAERGEQDLWRGRPGAHRHAERLPGRRRCDRDLQPDGGETVAGSPVHAISATLSPAGRWPTTTSPTTPPPSRSPRRTRR